LSVFNGAKENAEDAENAESWCFSRLVA